jgi:tetratricopeptide (TPR) repeat protein
LLEREGKPAEAIRVLEDVLTQQPRAEEAYQALTALLFRQADAAARDKLATWIPRWRKELPDSLAGVKSQVRWTAGARAEEADQAARDLCKRLEEKAADRIPAKPRADVTIRLAKAEDETTPAGPSPRTLLCLATAEGFTQAQAWDRAREWLDRALTEQPESEAARLQLGELYLQRLTSEEGKKAAAEQRRAWAEEAKRAYVVVYQRRKGHLVAGNNLAWLLAHELNDPEEAWRITKEVRTGRHSSRPLPGDRLPAELLDTIGQVFAALNKPELAGEVRDLFEAAKQRYPNDPRMFLHLGHAYVALRQPRKAEQCFAAAIALAGPAGKTGPLAPPQRARVVEEARAAQQKLAAGG